MSLRSSGIENPYHVKGKRVMVYADNTDGLSLAAMFNEMGIEEEAFTPILLEHPEEIIDLITHDYGVQKSREHLRYEADVIRRMIEPEYIELGKLDIGRLRYTAEALHRLGFVNSDIVPDGFVFAEIPQPSIALTAEERDFIAAHPVVRVHNEQAWEPFNFAEKGRPTGLMLALLQQQKTIDH